MPCAALELDASTSRLASNYLRLTRLCLASEQPLFAAKVVTDQAIGPPLVIGAFCLSQPVLNGDGLSGGVEMLRRDWSRVLVTCWQVWIPVQCVVFGAVPLKFRILCMNVVSFGWSTFMSSAGGTTAAPEEERRR